MPQKYKLPVIVKSSRAALLRLFLLSFCLIGFKACRISDIQSFPTDDAYFSRSDLPKTDYIPLGTNTGSILSDALEDSSLLISSGVKRDAFGNLIISSGEPVLNYEDYYDYSYSSRLRRFGSVAAFSDYFSPWYTDHYWFSHELNYWGINIYETTSWYWFGNCSQFNPNWILWGLNSGLSAYNWPNSWLNSKFFWPSVSNPNSESDGNLFVFRKRTAPAILKSTFSGFTYSGRPTEQPGNFSESESGIRPARPNSTLLRNNPENSTKPPNIRQANTDNPPIRINSVPTNSATRFDNRKENGLIREEPSTTIPKVYTPPATNTGRKATFGEGSRTVPRSAAPVVRSGSPNYSPINRSSSPTRSSGFDSQRQPSAPIRSTPSGQRPR